MLSFRCGDVGIQCDSEFNGITEEEIIIKVKEHGKNEHGLHEDDFTPTLMEKIKSNIKKNEK